MQMTLAELAALVGGELQGAADLVVTAPAPLATAGPRSVAYAGPKLLKEAGESGAAVVLVPASAPDLGRPVIRVENPRLAFIKVLQAFDPTPAPPAGVHPRAVVDPAAVVGEGVTILANAVVAAGARIGDRVVLHPGVYVGPGAVIGADTLVHPNVTVGARVEVGRRCIIQPGAVIGSDGFGYEWEGDQMVKIPHIGTVIIEDDVEIGAGTCIDRATMGVARIGRGTKLDNLIHIGHNCNIGEHSVLCAQIGLAGSTDIGSRVTMAGRSGAAGHLKIADGVVMMGNTVATKDLEKGIYSGFPATPHREQLRLDASLRKVPELIKRVADLEKAE